MSTREEMLKSIMASIEDAAYQEDQDMLCETIGRIPEDFWQDAEYIIKILDGFLSYIKSDFYVYPIDFIPDEFWEDEDMVWSYAVTLSRYYQDGNIDYNMSELFPMELLADGDIAKLFLYANYRETVDYIPGELMGECEMIAEAIDGIEFAFGQHERLGSMVDPLNAGEYLKALLDKIPDGMAADKDLVSDIINDIMSRDCISDGIGVLFSWIDKSLWAERDFVISVIGNSPSDVITHVPEKLFGDPEFIAALEELYDICEWGRELLDGGEECGMLLILNAAKNGNADAQFQLAEMYNTGDGVEESPAEALKWYRAAAENGSSDAQFSLAEMYRYGDGVEKDFETALLWYKRAAEGGNHDAMSALGFIYYRGDGVEKDYNEAYHWFKTDGFRGLPYFVYADMFFYVDKDYSSAFMLYRAALQQGVEEAGYKMGEMYFYGLGVEQNYDEAFKFLKYYNGEFEERFFDWAPAKVHFMLSEMYANGWGVEKDLQEAAKLRIAAEKGEDY